MLTAYLWVAGEGFNAKQFDREHEGKGMLRETKVMQGRRVVPGPVEWESSRIEVPAQLPSDQVVGDLLQWFVPIIEDAKRGGATEIYLQFLGQYVDRDANGLHLSPELMRALAERGVSVDYDIVRTAQAA